MYRFAQPRPGGPVHRVHVDGDVAFKHEPCNLDDAAYKHLYLERPEGPNCKHCWRSAAIEEQDEKDERKVPARMEVPAGLLTATRRAALGAMAFVAAAALLAGSSAGVVLSPDVDPPSPSPPTGTCDLATREGCGDLVILIQQLIDENLLHHLTIDHPPERTPWPSPSPSTTSSTGGTSASPTPSRTARPTTGGATRTASPRSTPTSRPTPKVTPTVTSPPKPTPNPTCFRPGSPQGGKDPCQWPPDDK